MDAIGKLPPQEWISNEGTIKVMEALMAGGKPARFVGGCVRDALLNRQVSDIDIATPESPERSQYLLEEAGIRVIPVGLSHGAILALTDEMSFHVTTLRRDVETYGRKAKVSYVDDWHEDARRRDFTMNSLYVDLDRTLYDPCGGLEDVKSGRVRFIGEPEQRIREDYLRILRFFRFQAYYGVEPPEEEDLIACQKAASHIRLLSTERIWYELKRLFQAANPQEVLQIMAKYEILNPIFSFKIKDETITHCLRNLIQLEEELQAPNRVIRRLACLLDGSVQNSQNIRKDLPLSGEELQYLIKLSKLINDKPDLENDYQLYRVLYMFGADLYYDYLLLLAARNKGFDPKKKLEVLSTWTSPKLPIQGRDLIELGYSSGPRIGKILDQMTVWWLENKCTPTKQECLEWMQRNNL